MAVAGRNTVAFLEKRPGLFFPELLPTRAGLGHSLFPEQTREISPGQEVRRLKMSSWDVTRGGCSALHQLCRLGAAPGAALGAQEGETSWNQIGHQDLPNSSSK